MADQIKEQDPKQATPADSSSDQTQAGPSPSSELKEEDSKKHGPRRTSVFLYLAVLFAAAFTMLFILCSSGPTTRLSIPFRTR